jgi:hypothetical protein
MRYAFPVENCARLSWERRHFSIPTGDFVKRTAPHSIVSETRSKVIFAPFWEAKARDRSSSAHF